jgi:hypothetical protein
VRRAIGLVEGLLAGLAEAGDGPAALEAALTRLASAKDSAQAALAVLLSG